MHCQHVNLVGADESINDAVRPVNNFPDERILEFWDCASRLGELRQAFCGGDETSDDDRRVMR